MPNLLEPTARKTPHGSLQLGLRAIGLVVLFVLTYGLAVAAKPPLVSSGTQRKALVLGRGEPFRDPNGSLTHPQVAKNYFLKFVGNPNNDPAKGWTADLSWDLMLRLGMDPTNTPPETLFNYIGQHRLGYRIVIQNGAFGQQASPMWSCALDNGMMPFAPHGDNTPGRYVSDAPGFKAVIAVGGGVPHNFYSYGPALEFFDAVPLWASQVGFEDAVQSWANQVLASRFARVLDAHPGYNIYDARQHLRQSASYYARGWTETNGYGRANENAAVGKLLPAPPLEFQATLSRNRRQIDFTWRNFLQSDFASTMITRKDGRVIYDGPGTNFTWTSDVDGDETFTYVSKNQAGEKSRLESFQIRKVAGLVCRQNPTCLILGAPAGSDEINGSMRRVFEADAPGWTCDLIYRPGSAFFNAAQPLPQFNVVAALPDFSAMAAYAISNRYRILVAPVPSGTTDSFWQNKSDWDRAVANGVTIVASHNVFLTIRKPETNQFPPRLYSAITVCLAVSNKLFRAQGPGLEFIDNPDSVNAMVHPLARPNLAAAEIAAKLACILQANPAYNLWDARQHLRQSASNYPTGWTADGGYGQPPVQPAKLVTLDPAPPLDLQVVKSDDGRSITFSWQNFLQTSFAETVIQRNDGRVIYHGTGTNFVWRSDVTGDETFRFFSKDKTGKLSRAEQFTAVPVPGLARN